MLGGLGFLIAVVALAGVAAALTGGRLGALLATPVRWAPVVFVAFALQVLTGLADWGGTVEEAMVGLQVGSYLLLLGFLARNRRLPGVALVAAGVALNGLVIAVNRGMPTSLPAGVRMEETVKHHERRPSDKLVVLSDVIVVRPLGESLSIGDLLLAAGLVQLVVTRSRDPAGRRPPPPGGRAQPEGGDGLR
jgi:hypothetical protein